jgi:phage tail tube protein FII
MAKLYVPEAFNLFAGPASNTEASKHLTITENTFPKMDEKTVEHHPGGSIGAVELSGFGLQALSHGFKLSGADPQTMALFGASSTQWTSYAVLRDKQTGAAVEWKVVEFGRLVSLENDALKRGDLQSQTHMIKEILHYEMYIGGVEQYFYDFFSSVWRVNGVDQNQASNAILRIPGAA